MFPERLDDFVAEDNPVRVIDVFVDELDVSGLGFKEPSEMGRPGYDPRTMLKIYIYGYLNRVQSSRRLEREAQRNLELMWLTGRLAPDFKTIADFRKDNAEAIRLVSREFVMLCRKVKLFTEHLVAIDGSKFKAVNNRDKNFTREKMKRRLAEVEASIERYLGRLEEADRDEAAKASTERLEKKVGALREEMSRLKKLEIQMLESPDEQLSLTDPDSRSMNCRGSGIVGYNVQTAVETKTHLIVAHEVTNVGSDRRQLAKMADEARTAMGVDSVSVVADRGYYCSEELLKCERAQITAYIPKPLSSRHRANGLYPREVFRYVREDDEYECPAGKRLTLRTRTLQNGLILHRYWSIQCGECALKPRCTTGPERRVSRWEHEDVLEAAQVRLDKRPEVIRVRRATVEHPFGTLKAWMGATHFLTKTLRKVSAEMSLHVLAYNMKRAIQILGVRPLLAAVRA